MITSKNLILPTVLPLFSRRPDISVKRRGNGSAGGFTPGDVATDYFQALGGTQPWYAGSTQYHALHYNGKTYVAWETYERTSDRRHTQIRAYTHATGLWGKVYTVGPASQVKDDDHGVPAMAVNADGRISIAWGNHDGNFHLATMTNPEDESHWTVLANTAGLVGRYTYPHMVLSGTTMYVLLRVDVPPGAEFAAGAKYLAYRPITYSGATATIGAEVKIADFGNDSRWYQGNHLLLPSGRIAQVCARADYNDTFRRDVYYYEVDIANARLQSFGGATAAFPVNRATMDATFRVRETVAPAELGVPSMVIDGSNRVHIVFGEGTTAPTLYHIIGSAGVFATAVNLGAVANTSTLADGPRLIHEASGKVGMYYPTDPGAAYTRGGRVSRRVLPSAGAATDWGAEELVLSPDAGRFPIGQIGVVFNAHADARLIITEAAETDADSAGFPQKRAFILGDNGFIQNPRPTGSAPVISGMGAWYDPSDITSLWSDLGRTTQAVVDGPVRVIDDKSGNGLHLVLEGSEPGTLRLDDGLYWIDIGDEFSPTTSYAVTGVVLPVSNAYWVAGGFRDYNVTSGSTSHNFINIDEGSGQDRVFSIARTNASSNGEGQLNVTPFSNTGSGAAMTSPANGLRGNDDVIAGLHVNGTAATSYMNGAQMGTATVGSVPDTGSARIRIGANGTLAANSYLIGRFYGAVLRSGNIDLATRQADMAYIRSKMPL
ncbi:BNR repeat-containing protein [Rhizobium phage RHph_X3_2]|nr:BNR repeat-containing protein [Rhizobium phage RHph_X3_2]